MIADTALVTTGFFTHYCHEKKTLIMLRTKHPHCYFCKQKNPDYIPNTLIWTVMDFESGSVILAFTKEAHAIKFIQDRPEQSLCLGDSGFVHSAATEL